MITISITDSLDATAELTIDDASPLAKAKLIHLVSSAEAIVKNFSHLLDQTDISSAALGAQFTSPSLLSGIPSLKVSSGVNCDLAIFTKNDKVLFADDGFSPVIPILSNQAWVEFGVDASIEGDLSASADGFGVAASGSTQLSLLSFVLFEGTPLPLLKDALETTIGRFSVSSNPGAIRSQKAGTVNVCDLSGSISVTGSYSVPFSLSPLASASLPFNFDVNVAPSATAVVTGSLTLSGDFLARIHKVDDAKVQFGIYKKRGSTFTVSLDAEAGITAGTESKDLLGTLLNTMLPGVDVAKSGIPLETAAQLNAVIKDGLDRSIAIELNAMCSAATTHEAAVLYEVGLSVGDSAATDAALSAALKGDWTLLGNLQNARELRNIIVVTKERKQKLNFNLLGVYSASSLTDYVAKCTILKDDTGQLTVVDKLEASRISATTAPYAADADKLRTALAQDFLATASYAVIGSQLNLQLSIGQSYLVYAQSMGRQQMRNNIALGNCLGVIPEGLFDNILASTPTFPHARVSVSISYDGPAVMGLFFSDVAARVPRTSQELEETGRGAMVSLLDATDPANAERIAVLKDDSIWSAMDSTGNIGAFDTIPYLSHLNPTELGAVGVDWVSVAWWRDSMLQVAPALAQILSTIANSTLKDPTQDPSFLSQRAKLAGVLGSVARHTNDAFIGGWGPAVIFALSGRHGAVVMDVAWGNNDRHFTSV